MLLYGIEYGAIHSKPLDDPTTSIGTEPREQPCTTGLHVIVGCFEVARAPGVGDVASAPSELKQFAQSSMRHAHRTPLSPFLRTEGAAASSGSSTSP